MAWPYPHLVYATQGNRTGGTIPAHGAGDLIFYVCNHNVGVDGGITGPTDDGGGSWAAVTEDLDYAPAWREQHDLWVKVATGSETTITASGSIDLDAIVVAKARAGLSAFDGYLDQAGAVRSNPGWPGASMTTPSVSFNGGPNLELLFFTLGGDGGSLRADDYSGENGLIHFDEGDILDNGLIVWARRVSGSSSPGSLFTTTGAEIEGVTAVYLFLPFSGWRVGSIAIG